MRRKTLTLGLSLLALTGIASAITLQFSTSFLSAPAGVSIPSAPLTLPPVTGSPSIGGVPGPFGPSFSQLVNEQTVITTEAQWQSVWRRLFGTQRPFQKVNFNQEAIVLMGGGLMTIESFSISSVERVDASWNSFFGGSVTDPFLAVTSTTLIPGVAPPMFPPPTYRVAAVRIPRAELSEVVFHREVIPLP